MFKQVELIELPRVLITEQMNFKLTIEKRPDSFVTSITALRNKSRKRLTVLISFYNYEQEKIKSLSIKLHDFRASPFIEKL